jgi:hypothetical protein
MMIGSVVASRFRPDVASTSGSSLDAKALAELTASVKAHGVLQEADLEPSPEVAALPMRFVL